MFLVADRTRTVLHHVRFVERVGPFVLLEMAGLAILVDRIKGDAVTKAIVQHLLEYARGQSAGGEQRLVVTARAVVDQGRMTVREFSRVKESFVAASVKSDDGGEADGD